MNTASSRFTAASKQLLTAMTLACAPSLWAQETPSAPATGNRTAAAPEVFQLDPLTVIGSKENLERLPGSGAYIAGQELRETGNLTLGRVTARVPGVYVREEDGYGNFINLSIRGVDGTRSRKITLMEDGILTAPSPYAAPDAYYSPKLGRMSGLEILKGSSQIAYGPHTTGGVANFLSTPVPSERAFYSRTTVGTDATFFNHTTFGETIATDSAGNFGYLVELHGQTTDGFRKIDGTSRDSGFDLVEPMVKLFWEPGTSLAQRFEFKVGYTDFDANESYSGLTVADLRANPDRRYAGSQFDRMESEHWRTYLKYIVQPSSAVRIESALYYTSFERTWDKLDALSGTTRTNVAEALLDPSALLVLQGLGPGNVITRAAYRDHDARGWQTRANFAFETGEIDHAFSVGLRFHEDRVAGTNLATTYASDGTGGFGPGVAGTVASAGSSKVFATALHAENAMTLGRLTVTPGVRHEWLDWTNVTGGGSRATGNEEFTTAGLGLSFAANEQNTVFGGIYRGVSIPNPGGYRNNTEEETSLGLELGLRHRREHLRGELVAFHSTFEDLIAPQVGIGGGGLLPSTNGGGAEVYGLESLLEYDLGRASGWAYGLPVYFSATWTSAEFTDLNGTRLGNGAGVFAGAVDGNEIPYVPEWKLATGAALVAERWTARVDLSYVSSTWGSGYNGNPRLNADDTPANASAVDGRVDSLFIVDITGHYDLTKNVRLVGGVQNLFDERAIISRVPLGPRANAPRFVFAGAEVRF
jgi:Fe(3+) dicitrate transport protein